MHKTAHWLVLVGALNWLLVGLFSEDILGFLGLDQSGWLARAVYIVIGLAALFMIFKKKQQVAPAPQM